MRQSNYKAAIQTTSEIFHQLTSRPLRSLFGLSLALAVPVTAPVLMLAPGMVTPAYAASADCNILNAASYVANANGNFSLNSFQLFTLNAGEVISFSANVPAGARVVVTFSGISVTLDNSTGTSAQTLSGTITVPSSGATTTSAVLIAVTGLITGGSVTTNFDCSGTTTSTPAPGSSSVNQQYAHAADTGVGAFITLTTPGAPIGRAREDLFPDLFAESVSTLDDFEEEDIQCKEEIKEVQDALASGSEQAEVERAKANLRECLDDDSRVPFFGSATVFLNETYAPLPKPTAGEKAIRRVTATPYAYSASLTPGLGSLNGRFALANRKAKRPWMIFGSAFVVGLNDDRTGADRQARIWTTSVGGKIRWNRKTTLGITGGYRSGTVTSKANASKLTGDYASVTISGDYLLMKALSLGFAATYMHGENTLAIGGGTGDFGVDMFNASASLSGAFNWNELVIAPSLSAGISRVLRDGYTDSNGVIVPGSQKTHGNINFGSSVSKTFFFVDGFKSITPSLSLGGGYFFREDFDATLPSGATAKQFGLGANLATGLDLQMNNGFGLNFGGSYGMFQNDIQIWSVNARLSKKF